ncbi:MAG: DUF1194 domain-containing protein [Gammaproteobacteria bacterium]|nr:DUF1194 domain-containing protein [Gammaproteobacteria bacterium]
MGGAGAFVLTAETYEDFAEAMRDKLLQEISGVTVATAAPDLSGSQWCTVRMGFTPSNMGSSSTPSASPNFETMM